VPRDARRDEPFAKFSAVIPFPSVGSGSAQAVSIKEPDRGTLNRENEPTLRDRESVFAAELRERIRKRSP